MESKRFSFNEQAFLENYAFFSTRTVGSCGAVVKGNAYGTGARRAVRLLHHAGCEHFFVASLTEGVEIRELTTTNIYVLTGPMNDTSAKCMTQHNLIPVVNSPNQLKLWEPYREYPCAIHVDTGMNRLGFEPDSIVGLDYSPFNVCLLITHLACADQPGHPQNKQQFENFKNISYYFPNTPTSVGNSAGILMGEMFQGDITRPGIGLYGGNPFIDRESPVREVCSLEGRVLQIRTVPSNTSVGYGASYTSQTLIRVATVGIGYVDGLSRALSNRGSVAFRGQRMPIIGKITMDATQIDCTLAPELNENDFVEFFGPTISVDEVATTMNTIAYEVLTHVGNPIAPGQESRKS